MIGALMPSNEQRGVWSMVSSGQLVTAADDTPRAAEREASVTSM
jgi:hypothetical protein